MNLYSRCKKKLLDVQYKYKYLVEFCENSNTNNPQVQKEINLYVNGLEEFYAKNVQNIFKHEKRIAYNYFKYLSLFYHYSSLENYSIDYLKEFRISVIRTLEIALFLQLKNLDINRIFFVDKYETFYENLLYIYNIGFLKKPMVNYSRAAKLLDETIKIYQDGIVLEHQGMDLRFKSTVKQPVGYTGRANLQLYLRLMKKPVNDVFYTHLLRNKDGSGGSGKGVFNLIPLDLSPKRIDNENKIIPKIDRIWQTNLSENNIDNDEHYESAAKGLTRILNKNNKFCDIYDLVVEYNRYIDSEKKAKVSKKSNKSEYKKQKLNQAIGHLQAKSNLYIPSRYTVSNYKLLAVFLHNIKKQDSFEYQIIILSILLGIKYERILETLMEGSTEMELVKNMLRVHLTTAYADTNKFDIFQKTNKHIEFELPPFILSLIKNLEHIFFEKLSNNIEKHNSLLGDDLKKQFFACKKSKHLLSFMFSNFEKNNYEEILQSLKEDVKIDLQTFLKEEKKKFSKTISVSIRNLHILSFYYYKQIHKESEISMLFLKNKTANIHTKLAYVQTPKKLLNMTLWLNELIDLLNLDDNKQYNLRISSEYSGSDKVIQAIKFKNFMNILTSLKLSNTYANITARMIYLRFAFSILLATRPYHFSSDLRQYSKREKLLFIHEKAKNVYTSKRVIPLTNLGNQYVQYFYRLREVFNITSYFPVILLADGKVVDLTNKSLQNWLEVNKDELKRQLSEDKYQILENFFKEILFDFGRHIFLSKAHNDMEVKQDYADAMVNHFEKGTQDQGVYSIFDNKQYFHEVRELMQKIEKEYIPFCKFLSEDCNDI